MSNHQNQGKKVHLLPFIKGVIKMNETIVVAGIKDGLVIVVSHLLIP